MTYDPFAVASLAVSILGGSGLLAYLRFFRDRRLAQEQWIKGLIQAAMPAVVDPQVFRDLQDSLSSLRHDVDALSGRCRREDFSDLEDKLHALELRMVGLESEQRHVTKGVDSKLNQALAGIQRLTRIHEGE